MSIVDSCGKDTYKSQDSWLDLTMQGNHPAQVGSGRAADHSYTLAVDRDTFWKLLLELGGAESWKDRFGIFKNIESRKLWQERVASRGECKATRMTVLCIL